MPIQSKDASIDEINQAMDAAWEASRIFGNSSLKQRSALMYAIAEGLENSGEGLITTAMEETNLPEARLKNERNRTIFQLRSYADACVAGQWLDARIDTANSQKTPPSPDIRKMLVPLGPVLVFGASNFPFAYSTAGGDTACALAAGCPVIVKAHPAHARTSTMVAEIIAAAVSSQKLPAATFTHIHGASFEVGKALIMHPHCKAVGFTGSYMGGKQLFDWAAQRKEPIPVFAEMGSINPVFLLPGKLKEHAARVAADYAASITLGVGQFCTNPGLLIGMAGEELKVFANELGNAIRQATPGKMLHPGIGKAYAEKRAAALAQKGIELLASSSVKADEEAAGIPTIASVPGAVFLQNPLLHQEVFGPYSLLVECNDANEMLQVARTIEGQLTATVMATEQDLHDHGNLLDAIKQICGRLIFNGVPTGVEVCLSMQHGGPFPATTDARFTSVGADGIRRFARPLAYQNCPDSLLPDELKNDNPLHIWRTVNNELTKDKLPLL